MKIEFDYRNHIPSKSTLDLIERELTAMLPDLQIDAARIKIKRSLTESPPFCISIHLVTPGPDVVVSSTDHTLLAATNKAIRRIGERIHHRQTKRSRRREAAPAIELTRRRLSGTNHR